MRKQIKMSQQFTRKQLYDLVWSKSMIQLSKEFGLSDNGLRKICKKYDIPIPKVGYWQKIQYRKKVEQEKLEYFDKWVDTKIVINESDKQEDYQTTIARRINEIEQVCSKLLPVSETLLKPHPLVKAAKVNLNAQKKRTSWRNLPECIHTDRNILSISVQKHNVNRALRIMDVFIKMIECRDHTVVIESEATKLIVFGEMFAIRFREKHTRQNIPDEKWATTEMVPNNRLSIKYDYHFDKEWTDKGTLLEEQLPKIIAFFELKSIEIKEQRERNRIAKIEADRKREIEQKLQLRQEWEIKKKDILIISSQEWHKAEYLRCFIAKIEENNDNSEKTQKWLKWANLQLEKLNPLSKGIEAFISQFDIP